MSGAEAQDPQAWLRSVLDRYEGPLMRYAVRLTGDVEHARDVVQDTFLRFMTDGAPRDDAHAPAWLYKVCRNRAFDLRRKERHMKPLTQCADVVDAEAPPDAELDRRETRTRLKTLLSRLPERQQEIIRLRFQGELSYREIGEVMEISVTNVGYLMHTAIKRLREGASAAGQPDVSHSGGVS